MKSSFKLPLIGRFAITRDRHGAGIAGATAFQTNLSVKVLDKNGKERKVRSYFGANPIQRLWYSLLYRNKTELNLGSGLVTNVAVLGLANSFNFANVSGTPNNTLSLANYHATGTGTTAAAATDYKLQTVSTQGGQTPVTGTQTLVSAANLQKYQTVATINYTGTEAVTEWGLFCKNALTSTTGTPFTATTATSATATGTPYTASSTTVQGLQQQIIEAGTTTVWGLILNNTTNVMNIPAWYTQSAGTAGSTPGSTEAFTLRPIMWDHKVFSAINVNSGDSIQFTYQLTVVSGG